LRGSNTEMAAKPKRGAVMQTASVPAALQSKPQEAAPAKPAAVAKSAPATAPQRAAPEIRTAYSAPQSNNNGLLSGAQPVVPAGSFESRWTAFR
jgi:hypothetical protein